MTAQEAQRRLDRIEPIQQILASIRGVEGDRIAGWGIDHRGTFTGWVWLTGSQPPSASAASIADAHSDIEIRTGADHSYEALLEAQEELGEVGPVGDYVCHSGQVTKVTCGTVASINYQPNYDNACLDASGNETDCDNVFVKVTGTELESCGGDSGGPWYRSGVAYGIHMGHSPAKPNCDNPDVSFAFFSAIKEVESFLGVEILTDGSVTVN